MSAGNATVQDEGGDSYQSPYALHFSFPAAELAAGFDAAPWNDPAAESTQPFAEWEAQHAHARGAAWGPPARAYPAPSLPRQEVDYQRERVLSVAALHIGLAYQHHHLPSWSPPADWPWLRVKAGQNGPGLDCSNFTGFVFNYALGLRLPTAIGAQGKLAAIAGPGGAGCRPVQHIAAARYEALLPALAPADLLYFKDVHGRIRHTGFWMGSLGGAPLILDCTDTGHRDAQGQNVPTGVHLRPFTPESWYWRHFSHAQRILGAADHACRPPGLLPEGDDRG